MERADNIAAQFTAGVCRKSAYKSELSAVKYSLVKTRVERANPRWLVSYLVAKSREVSADLVLALSAVVVSSKSPFKNVADKVKAEMEQAGK